MKYQIIYAGPPWEYGGSLQKNAAAADHYPTMATERICELPVARMAAENCALFLWGTPPLMPDALAVMDAWGFQYKTKAFCWVKTNKNSMGLFWGMGKWTRANTEDCWLGVRGKIHAATHDIHQVVMSDALRHSQKPSIVREKIVQLVGDVSRVELFARRKVDGWDAWGNEVDSDLDMGGREWIGEKP